MSRANGALGAHKTSIGQTLPPGRGVSAPHAKRGDRWYFLLISSLILFSLAACNPSQRDARGAVITFLNAVTASDTLAILRSVTMDASYTLLSDSGVDTSAARSDTIMAARLVHELTLGGTLYNRWVDKRMVVGDVEFRGDDTALVEVSFLSQKTGVQYYNKFGLVNNKGFWQIFSFRMPTGLR